MKKTKTVVEFLKRAPKSGPRVLVADIETFPIIAYVWGLFKQNVGLNQIKEGTRMMSFAGKWLGDNAYYYVDNRDEADPRNDHLPVRAAWAILHETDFVIAHNGAQFDMRKMRARFAELSYAPLPPVKVIDTLLLNRAAFGFDSQKLAHVTSLVGSHEKDDHAEFPGFELWKECMAGNPKAWKACERYNVQDITSLEAMYMELRGWYVGVPNFGPYVEAAEGEHTCPTCGSHDVKVHKKNRHTQVGTYHQYVCNDCGSYSRGRFLIASRADRAHILIN